MIAGRVRVHGISDLGPTLAAIVRRIADAAGLGHSQAYRLRLAAEEITTNIVTHGYREQGGTVEIDGGLDDDWVWLRMVDDAPEFDPNSFDPTARLAVDPSLAPLGGFGLLLALSSVDRLEHEYSGGRNRTVLKIRRSSSGGNNGDAARSGGG
jgi:serine/threonine-protein kinase RsbW